MGIAGVLSEMFERPRHPSHPSQPGIEEAFITVDEGGMIQDCEGDVECMLDYSPKRLQGKHVSVILPRLKYAELVQNGIVNPSLSYLCHIGLLFQVRRRDLDQFLGHLSIVDLRNSDDRRLRLRVSRSC